MSKQKFTVTITDAPHGLFTIKVTNRAGRAWVSKDSTGDLGNVGEEAMIIEEMINGGEKLNKAYWREVGA